MSQTIKTSPSEATRQAKIGKRVVDAIKPGDRDQFLWDPEVRGFGVRCKPSGNKSYLVQFRNSHGRSRRVTIGRCNVLTADEARREARVILADAQRGDDRAAERRADREAPTVADLA
ncbi:MAG: Arm DNA-binding domain-containing protein, partial [Alphaproteobacteria bacterium]